jgi:predicted nucleic acid-binding protein
MPDARRAIVTDTTPLIALAAGTGELEILRALYDRVIVPFEVAEELHAAGGDALGVAAFEKATWLERRTAVVPISQLLGNTLDRGEASVIQTALNEGLALVCIDETVGRRVARMSGLTLTGSIGVLIKAKRRGYAISIPQVLDRMREHGIWLSEDVVRFALMHSD